MEIIVRHVILVIFLHQTTVFHVGIIVLHVLLKILAYLAREGIFVTKMIIVSYVVKLVLNVIHIKTVRNVLDHFIYQLVNVTDVLLVVLVAQVLPHVKLVFHTHIY
jgi:hypothetical protein